ncbi:hypothetical protein DY000_02003003 [Brassica cretica]|uniref:Protein kinase domain-containing protein n=1 Tax=Brassica cretica TaxID=69181 RepID=A0ABQ7CJ36_BRACR|nr:hypothetical protein DY000_02003003 [Brassica cretica]
MVGDFALAKLLDHQDSHIKNAVRGTVGHIVPDQSLEKTDVFRDDGKLSSEALSEASGHGVVQVGTTHITHNEIAVKSMRGRDKAIRVSLLNTLCEA